MTDENFEFARFAAPEGMEVLHLDIAAARGVGNIDDSEGLAFLVPQHPHPGFVADFSCRKSNALHNLLEYHLFGAFVGWVVCLAPKRMKRAKRRSKSRKSVPVRRTTRVLTRNRLPGLWHRPEVRFEFHLTEAQMLGAVCKTGGEA